MDFQKLHNFATELYSNYLSNRQRDFEPYWNDAYNNFHRIDNIKWKKGEGEGWRSDTYVDIVKQKITSGVNLVNDMVFKNGVIPFNIEDPVNLYDIPIGDSTPMENLIEDQFKLGKARKEVEATILSGGIYGNGFCRVFLENKQVLTFASIGDNYEEVYRDVEFKRIENVSVWNMFWDAEVDDLRDAKGIFERKYLTITDLKNIRDNDEFVRKSAINKAIILGVDTSEDFNQSDAPDFRDSSFRTREIRYLECWLEYEDKFIYCAICNGSIVKYTEADRSDIPYYKFTWEDNCDCPRGIGISENIGDLQSVINGGFRSFEDNKKLSGNNVFAGRPSAVKNLKDGIVPGKVLLVDDSVDSIKEAIETFVIPDVGESLLSVVNMAMQLADMSSNIPRASQGQESSNPQTAYEIQQRLERAGKYIGRVISNVDRFMEPIIEKFYNLNMIDPNVPFDIKIPGQIQVQGFSSYESRVLKMQKLMATMQLFAQDQNLYSKFQPDWILKEVIKSNDINPDLVLKSEEQLQQEAEIAAAAQEREELKSEMEAEKTRAEIQKIYAERDKIIMETEGILDEDKSNNEKK